VAGSEIERLVRSKHYGHSEFYAIAHQSGRIIEQLRLIPWKYSDPTRRIRRNVVSATCY
jgi:hypothetical protein